MSGDAPDSTPSRNRPDAGVRRRSLGLGGEGGGAADRDANGAAAGGVSDRARSFRELLDAIPDLDAPTAEDATPTPAAIATALADPPLPAPPETASPEPDADAKVRTEDVLVVAPPDLEVEPDGEPAPSRVRDRTAPPAPPKRKGRAVPARRRPPWWRRVAFALATILLVVAIPVLGREGYRLVVNSTDGKDVTRVSDPAAPGYETIVDSTPTMVMVETAADGSLDSLTFVSLNSEKGGTVMFVPIMTALKTPAFGLGSIEMVYDLDLPRIDKAQAAGAREVGLVLNVGVDEVVPVDDRSLAQLIAPVGSIPVDNPAPMTLPDGTVLPAGQISLTPEQVGPYLGHLDEGEDQLSQFVRQERVWRSWLNAIAASSDPGIVPGPTDQGIGLFLRRLASGAVNYVTLPGAFDEAGLFVPDEELMSEAVVDAVPVPDPPVPGARVLVRLLNGVEAGSPSGAIVRRIVENEGSVAIIGNGPSFGNATTEIVYGDPADEDAARSMLDALGADGGTVRLDPSAPDNLDLTVIVGRDVVDTIGGT